MLETQKVWPNGILCSERRARYNRTP